MSELCIRLDIRLLGLMSKGIGTTLIIQFGVTYLKYLEGRRYDDMYEACMTSVWHCKTLDLIPLLSFETNLNGGA